MAYATVDQLVARWQPLDSAQQEQAQILLEDASVQIRSEIPDLAARVDAGNTDLLQAAIRVECAMVKRAMSGGDAGIGVTSLQETQGPFSHTLQYSNPMGDLYLTKAERRLLGSGKSTAFAIEMGPAAAPYILDELAYVRLASANYEGLSGFTG